MNSEYSESSPIVMTLAQDCIVDLSFFSLGKDSGLFVLQYSRPVQCEDQDKTGAEFRILADRTTRLA
jgi:hypothetical protein